MPALSILQAALLGTTALTLVASGPALARVGVTSATDGDPRGRPPQEAERILRIGIDVQANEVITTGSNDRAHLVFLDGTSLTVGPNALISIDKFVYDPDTKTGELTVNASKGVLRLVGGKISKTNPITITTPSSTIGIRGGITMLNVESSRTTSTFVFGDRMTVSGHGQTQNVTRPGSQVTTNAGAPPAQPVMAPPGSLTGQMGQLEGSNSGGPNSQGNQSGNSGDRQNNAGGGQGQQQGGGNADQRAQQFSQQNSGQGPNGVQGPPNQGPPPPTNSPGNPGNGPNQAANAVSNAGQQHAQSGQTTTSSTSTTNNTLVIVSRGKFLADPAYTNFVSSTLAVTPNTNNNQNLAQNATITNGTSILITLSDGRSIALPWQQNTLQNGFSIGTFTDSRFGTLTGTGYISASGDYFAYSFTNSSGKPVGFFGGTPTTTLPTSGIAKYDVTTLGVAGQLPFADATVGGDADLKAAAKISQLYIAFSPNNTVTVGSAPPGNARSEAMQSTVSISGVGANQKSYMGVMVGDLFYDARTNSPFEGGGFTGTYRLGSTNQIGRLASSVTTPETGSSSTAIYGSNANVMVFTPDELSTSYTTTTTGNTTTVSGVSSTYTNAASYNQQTPKTAGADYYAVTQAALVGNATTTTRTNQTVNGFVGGLIEQTTQTGNTTTTTTRAFGGTDTSSPALSLTTSATTNRAAATITIRDWDTNTTATFQLGGTTGGTYSTSAFIDDNTYALRDRPSSFLSNTTTMQAGNNTASATDVTSRTAMVSYNANPGTLDNLYTQANVTACTCAFLTYGWWGGQVAYGNSSVYQPGAVDRVNLAPYVAGTMSGASEFQTFSATTAAGFQNSSATYNGDMVGNVKNGNSSYIAVGGYSNNWNFGTQRGAVTITNFDGVNYTGNTALISNTVQFTGNITSSTNTVGVSATGNLTGAFFNNGSTVAAGQAGSFSITGNATAGNVTSSYQAGGTFKATR